MSGQLSRPLHQPSAEGLSVSMISPPGPTPDEFVVTNLIVCDVSVERCSRRCGQRTALKWCLTR